MKESQGEPICEIAIRNLVIAFHMRVRRDHVLAPVFAHAVGTTDADWARHTTQIQHFWASLMLAGRRRAEPAAARLPDLEPALFERWLTLLRGTCADLFEPTLAAAFQHHMARMLLAGGFASA